MLPIPPPHEYNTADVQTQIMGCSGAAPYVGFVSGDVPDANYAMAVKAPFVIDARKHELIQQGTVTGLSSTYPKTVSFDNNPINHYVNTPYISLVVTTNNATARLTAATSVTQIVIDVTPDSGDPTVTVEWTAVGN